MYSKVTSHHFEDLKYMYLRSTDDVVCAHLKFSRSERDLNLGSKVYKKASGVRTLIYQGPHLNSWCCLNLCDLNFKEPMSRQFAISANLAFRCLCLSKT